MGIKNLALALTITTFMFGCASLDTADTKDNLQQEIEATRPDRTSSQGLMRLSELGTDRLEGAQLQRDPRGPAPPVSYFQIFAVASSNSGLAWELVSAAQTITSIDHGGAQLDVAVYTFGFGQGSINQAGFPGVHWATDLVCGSFATAHFCNVGELGTGTIDYYSFDGIQGGGFSAFTFSINGPPGSWTDFITVR
jgi:hypothetical protein